METVCASVSLSLFISASPPLLGLASFRGFGAAVTPLRVRVRFPLGVRGLRCHTLFSSDALWLVFSTWNRPFHRIDLFFPLEADLGFCFACNFIHRPFSITNHWQSRILKLFKSSFFSIFLFLSLYPLLFKLMLPERPCGKTDAHRVDNGLKTAGWFIMGVCFSGKWKGPWPEGLRMLDETLNTR